MCGIVAGVANRDVSEILLVGLKRLEYRGYDSAGMALVDNSTDNPNTLQCQRYSGKVQQLENAMSAKPMHGNIGIAHTRWATHGTPSDNNAHPQFADDIAVVHNGIIENHEQLKQGLIKQGVVFSSDTDTEVIVHLLNNAYQKTQNLTQAFKATICQLEGAFAIVAMSCQQPDTLVAVRQGSPLVVGKGIGEMFFSSDSLALRQVTDQFFYPTDGDVMSITRQQLTLYDGVSDVVKSAQFTHLKVDVADIDKHPYRHFMEKEIHEQPQVVKNTAAPYLGKEQVLVEAFGVGSEKLFKSVKAVTMVACGSSYYAALVAKQWMESWLDIPCQVEIASEFVYRDNHVLNNCLFVAISQSGETADTLSAIRKAQKQKYIGCLGVCNVANSSLTREVDYTLITQAGFEISVASTKAFMSQLVALQLLVLTLGRYLGMDGNIIKDNIAALRQLPEKIEQVLGLEEEIIAIANRIAHNDNMLFLGRGIHYSIALEGALKMKELSYIHAEAYPSGELKHGPLALVSEQMPVIAIAPNNTLLKKLQSNLAEVTARGGKLYVITQSDVASMDNLQGIRLPAVAGSIMPMCYTVPTQLLAYHVAVIRGRDVDQPRNLAKSVTVE